MLLDKPMILTDILSSFFSLDDNFIGVSAAATPYCRKQFCSSRHICLPSRTIRVMMFKLLLFITFVLFLLTFSSCHISLPGGTWCLARYSASVCICIVMVGLHLHLHTCYVMCLKHTHASSDVASPDPYQFFVLDTSPNQSIMRCEATGLKQLQGSNHVFIFCPLTRHEVQLHFESSTSHSSFCNKQKLFRSLTILTR